MESHHERLDGRGYPNGVSAGQFDLAVRILTVADAYDALTADRVYRAACSADRALALLDDESDSAFDPDCVAALRAIVAVEQPERPAAVPALEHRPPTARRVRAPVYGEAAA